MNGGKTIFCLNFADNAIAISDTKEGLQSILRDLEKYCKATGMNVNTHTKSQNINMQKQEEKGEKGKVALQG